MNIEAIKTKSRSRNGVGKADKFKFADVYITKADVLKAARETVSLAVDALTSKMKPVTTKLGSSKYEWAIDFGSPVKIAQVRPDSVLPDAQPKPQRIVVDYPSVSSRKASTKGSFDPYAAARLKKKYGLKCRSRSSKRSIDDPTPTASDIEIIETPGLGAASPPAPAAAPPLPAPDADLDKPRGRGRPVIDRLCSQLEDLDVVKKMKLIYKRIYNQAIEKAKQLSQFVVCFLCGLFRIVDYEDDYGRVAHYHRLLKHHFRRSVVPSLRSLQERVRWLKDKTQAFFRNINDRAEEALHQKWERLEEAIYGHLLQLCPELAK